MDDKNVVKKRVTANSKIVLQGKENKNLVIHFFI